MIDASGTRVPIHVEWDNTGSTVTVHPERGVVLTPGERYVVGLTDTIRAVDGSPLRADGGFTSARAKPVHDHAVAALTAAGVTGTVVAATVFTVEDPTWLAKDLAARVATFYATNGPPTVTVTKVWKAGDGSLDELLGTPAIEQPGLDNPSEAGAIGKYAVAHEDIAFAVKGTFNSVRVITNDTELGVLMPETVPGASVPFLLIIPTGVDVTNMPVIVFHHGATGVLGQVFALAGIGARSQSAFLALETFLHGERASVLVDDAHALRGDDGELGPDGFAESSAVALGLKLLSIDGLPADQKGSALYGQGAIAQMAADYHALLTLVKSSSLTPIAAAESGLAGIAFDKTRVFYLGLSLGTVVGAVVLAGDSLISAGAFNVPLGSLVDALAENETFRTQVELLVYPALDIPNDAYEPERHLQAQPIVSMYRWVNTVVEPLSLVRHNASRTGRDLLWQIAGLDEAAGTPNGEQLVMAAGVPAIGEYASVEVLPGVAPLAGSGAYRFAQADHFMIGYRNGTSKFEAPGLPPFQKRPTPLMFENPIDAVHEQLGHFFNTRRATGTAEIR